VTEQADPIRVFLLNDHEVVRRGVPDLLETDPAIAVVVKRPTPGRPSTASRAAAGRGRADLRLPDGDG